MSRSWLSLFILANVFQFFFGAIITALSYSAYRSTGKQTFRTSTFGFLLITTGGVFAPLYEFGFKGDYDITARELLELQVIEGILFGAGLALLLFSIYRHTRRTATLTESEGDLHGQREDRNS